MEKNYITPELYNLSVIICKPAMIWEYRSYHSFPDNLLIDKK
jgi:hypothetical protein